MCEIQNYSEKACLNSAGEIKGWFLLQEHISKWMITQWDTFLIRQQVENNHWDVTPACMKFLIEFA